MEKKQLNFSAPLLSARRYSSPLRSSGEQKKTDYPPENRKSTLLQQSDLKMDEVVKPGSIPFMWEQIPGKAKDGIESQITSPEEFPSTPKLPLSMPFPPGRKSGELNGYRTPNKLSGELSIVKQRSKLSGELNVLRPQNRLSGELNHLRSLKNSGELNTVRPHNRFSGELNQLCKFSPYNDGMVRWDSSKEGTAMDASSESEDDDGNTFSDALDTFSQREAFSVNCSFSGLSGSERYESKPSEIISMDPKARDFMMNRFLPAAKAMTLEPSHYASRKQLVAVDQPKEVKALVPRAKTPPPSHNVCSIVPYTGQDIGSEESEEEEDSYDERSNISIKVKSCGFLPWFCSKNSLRLMNPLPAMKTRSKSALSSASKVGNLIKTKSWRSPSQKLVKQDSPSNHKHNVAPMFKSCELQKPKHTSKPMFYSGELQTRSGSPYRSSSRSYVSPYRNESPHSLKQMGIGFLAVPKRADSYDDDRSKVHQKGSKRFEEPKKNNKSSGTRTPVAEKTLYIDSVNIPKLSHSIMNVSKTKRQIDAYSKSGPLQEILKSETSFQHGGRMEIMKARGMSGPLAGGGAHANAPLRETVVSKSTKMSENGNTNTCRELVLVEDTVESSLTPPLPKSPTESWLSRQLPSVSPRVTPRNSVSYSSLNSKLLSRKQSAKTPSSGAKWETIVKSSHLRHDHGRFSEELVTHVRQPPQIWK